MKFVAFHVLPQGRSGAPVYDGSTLGGAVLRDEPVLGEDSQDSDDQDAEERVFLIQKPIRDLLYAEIDYSQNVLGNFFLERGHYTVIVGASEVGKSVVAVQMAVEAAAGLDVFGMPTPGPLRVVLVQAEDSDNDRKIQVRCIETIAHSEEAQERLGLTPEEIKERIENNFTLLTTNVRGAALFADLRKEFSDRATRKSKADLFIFNPAFAFLEGSASSDVAVNTFLRKQLQSFLRRMQAAAVIIHHVPKPPRSGTVKRSAATAMYAPHGSAEWTNGPRGGINIESTKSRTVFEFIIGKRGDKSGWEPNEDGYYIRYFSHAAKGLPMQWFPSTEEEIAAATQEVGLTDQDVLGLFTTSQPELTRSEISASLSAEDFIVSEDRLDRKLIALVAKGKLVKLPATLASEATYLKAGVAKKKEKALNTLEAVFDFIRKTGDTGANVTDIRVAMTGSCGSGTIEKHLTDLCDAGRIRLEQIKRSRRYFAV